MEVCEKKVTYTGSHYYWEPNFSAKLSLATFLMQQHLGEYSPPLFTIPETNAVVGIIPNCAQTGNTRCGAGLRARPSWFLGNGG